MLSLCYLSWQRFVTEEFLKVRKAGLELHEYRL